MKKTHLSIIAKEGTASVAKKLGYTRQYIWEVAKGRDPGRKFIKKFCEVYKISPATFF